MDYGDFDSLTFLQEAQQEKQRLLDDIVESDKVAKAKYDAVPKKKLRDLAFAASKVNRRHENFFKDPKLRFDLAVNLIKLEEFDEAVKALQDALEIDPNYYPAAYQLAKLYSRQRNFDQAESILNKLITNDPRNTATYLLALGDVFISKGEFDKALKTLDKCTKKNFPYVGLQYVSNVHRALGNVYFRMGDQDSAIHHFEQVTKKVGNTKYNIYEEREERDVKETIEHYFKHAKSDETKSKHGTFTIALPSYQEINRAIEETNVPPILGDMCKYYCFSSPNCGKDNMGQTLNHIIVITTPFTNKIITMYPGEKILYQDVYQDFIENNEYLGELTSENTKSQNKSA